MFERVAILVGIGDLMYDHKYLTTLEVQNKILLKQSLILKLDAFDYKFKVGDSQQMAFQITHQPYTLHSQTKVQMKTIKNF